MEKVYGVVITYNPDVKTLEQCIYSLSEQLNKMILVDNTPNGFKELEKFKALPNVEIIYLNDNYGIAYAQNVGIKKALEEKADYILLSDQDTLYPKGYIERMLECFADKKVAACGPMYFDTTSSSTQPFVKKTLFGFKKFYPKEGKHEVFQLIASGTILRSEYILNIGLFNEDLFIDWVDLEWCWRAVKKGYKILGNADVVIKHKLGESYKNLVFREVNLRNYIRHYYITRNAFYLSLYSKELDLLHKITLFFKSFRYIIGYSVLAKPHLLNLKYTLKGFYHGIIGRLGKLDESH